MRVAAKPKVQGSAHKALEVLRQFIGNERDLGVTELCRLTSLDKTSVFRSLKALELYRLVEQDRVSRRYRLSFGVLELAGAKFRQTPLTMLSQPHLARLSQATGETVQMSVLDGHQVLYISVVESAQPIRVAVGVGTHGPLYCTAAGKLLLAFAPAAVRNAVLEAPLQRFTVRTLTDAVQLGKELDTIRERGWAVDNEGFAKHVRVAAAPVRDSAGGVVAAVAVGGPTPRVTTARLRELAQKAVDAAAGISRDLGSSNGSAASTKRRDSLGSPIRTTT